MQLLQRVVGILAVLVLLCSCSVSILSLDYPIVFDHKDYKVYGTDDPIETIRERLQGQVDELTELENYRNAAVYLAKSGGNEYTITVNEDDLVFKYTYILLVNLR